MSNFDPTTNRIPFGLLTDDEQTALIHWTHGWEFWREEFSDEWVHVTDPEWYCNFVYRGKPAPVVTSKRFNVYPDGVVDTTHTSREKADKAADNDVRIAVLRIDTCNGVSTAYLEKTKEETNMDKDLKHFMLIITTMFIFIFAPVYFFGPSKMQTCIKAGYEWSNDEFGESCVKAIPDLWNGE